LRRALLFYFDLIFDTGTYPFTWDSHIFLQKLKIHLLSLWLKFETVVILKFLLTKGASLLLRGEKTQMISILQDLSPNFLKNDTAVLILEVKGIFSINPCMIFLYILTVTMSLRFGFWIYIYLERLNVLHSWFYKIEF
jgi:hypothetical protein